MSKEHLDDLSKMLVNYGWEIIDSNSKDIYTPYDDWRIIWNIFNENRYKFLTLEFLIVDDLGLYTKQLKDIAGCNVEKQNLMLLFTKRNSTKWKQTLENFVKTITYNCNVQPSCAKKV